MTNWPGIVLADARYWHQVQMEQLTGRGTVVLIPPDAGKRQGARAGWDSGLYAFMRRVLATDRGGELYAKRKGMIETIFADTKFNRRCDRFQRRGPIRRPLGMAPDHRDSQLAQAPPPPARDRRRRSLNGSDGTSAAASGPQSRPLERERALEASAAARTQAPAGVISARAFARQSPSGASAG
jgi:hypothetical protein